MTDRGLVPVERIERAIVVLRGHKVMLDDALAELYGVPVKVLNQAVKRNIERFPDDFMFQLTTDEAERLRSQSVTLKVGRGLHRKYLPYVFTEQGVAMLSTVLRSPQAGEEVRRPIQNGLPSHPRPDGPPDQNEAPPRLQGGQVIARLNRCQSHSCRRVFVGAPLAAPSGNESNP